jgi:DNA-binding beta-propeller fold protein YncE
MRMLPRLTLATLFAALLAATAPAQTWSVSKTLSIGGDGAWDYVTTDPATHRLFVTRTTHTQIIDEITGKVLGDVPGQVRSHGTAIVPKLNRGFITDGGGKGAILVFDLTTYATLGTLPAMPDADGIIYDSALNRVVFVSGDGNSLTAFDPAIDPKTGKLPPPIPLAGSPEFLVADSSGKIYVNLADKDLVAVVDLNARSVLSRWPVAPGGHPVGLSIDPAGHHLFIGCRKPQDLVVMNTQTGKIEATLPIGAGVDATAFASGQAFASTGDGAVTVAAEKDGNFTVVQTVKTPLGARTLAFDPASRLIFLPTAELEPAAAGARPRPKPDTFMIVVLAAK